MPKWKLGSSVGTVTKYDPIVAFCTDQIGAVYIVGKSKPTDKVTLPEATPR